MELLYAIFPVKPGTGKDSFGSTKKFE
jgi:hypothetical protein